MTPAERRLLGLVAQSVIVHLDEAASGGISHGYGPLVRAALDGVRKEWADEPKPVTPRAKFVSITTAPGETQFSCDACCTLSPRLVRLGEYYDPSFDVCPTCISEAAALLKEAT